jgi:hypothetical protein
VGFHSKKYESISFRDLVKMPIIEQWSESAPGDFGGMGMTAQESAIFYSIGIGDGSWGAFYDVCCIYPIRTAIFGFSSHLQLIHGRVDLEGSNASALALIKNATGVITFHKASRDPRITL